MSDIGPDRSGVGVLLTTAVFFAVGFLVLTSLLDVAFGDDLVGALRANLDNAIVAATVWTVAMALLRRRRRSA